MIDAEGGGAAEGRRGAPTRALGKGPAGAGGHWVSHWRVEIGQQRCF